MKKIIILTVFVIFGLSLLPAQQINGIVQEAVNKLASGLNAPLQVSISPVTMSGTNVPSELSRLLYNLISANVNINSRFQVVQPVRSVSAVQTGVISGTFTPKADVVDVSLTASERGVTRSTVQFSIPVAELRQLGISIEPENRNALLERERMFSGLSLPVQQPVSIQAWFNSDSMTYIHRETLGITVMADRDCYFKVILIDVNNQEQVIFPEEGEDNFLKANTAKKVFDDNYPYMLYGPYGAETILIVASQFANIRQDSLSPPRPATAASIRGAVTGNGAARYDINILKPYDEYDMAKPSDFSETIQKLKDDVNSQGGIFVVDKNEKSGIFDFPNVVRYSFHVAPDSNNRDSVEVAVYYQDIWNGYLNRTTRGTKPFSFPVDMPRDLNRAISTFREMCESNKGSFDGNTQKGSFIAKKSIVTIKGVYTVTNRIDITITDPPFGFSEKFIQDEIKKVLSGL